jgi:hypothetical protein
MLMIFSKGIQKPQRALAKPFLRPLRGGVRFQGSGPLAAVL